MGGRNVEVFEQCHFFYQKYGQADEVRSIQSLLGKTTKRVGSRRCPHNAFSGIRAGEAVESWRTQFTEVALDALSYSRPACDWFRCHILGMGPGQRFPAGCWQSEPFRLQAATVCYIVGGALRKCGLYPIRSFFE